MDLQQKHERVFDALLQFTLFYYLSTDSPKAQKRLELYTFDLCEDFSEEEVLNALKWLRRNDNQFPNLARIREVIRNQKIKAQKSVDYLRREKINEKFGDCPFCENKGQVSLYSLKDYFEFDQKDEETRGPLRVWSLYQCFCPRGEMLFPHLPPMSGLDLSFFGYSVSSTQSVLEKMREMGIGLKGGRPEQINGPMKEEEVPQKMLRRPLPQNNKEKRAKAWTWEELQSHE